MNIVRSTSGIVIIILGIVFLIISVGGIVGIWTYANDATRNTIDAIFVPVETALSEMQEEVAVIDSDLAETREVLARTETNITESEVSGKAQLSNSQAIGKVKTALVPKIKRVEQTVNSIQQIAQAIEALIEVFNALPLVSLPDLTLDDLLRASGQIAQLTAQDRGPEDVPSDATGETAILEELTATVAEIDSTLGDFQAYSAELQTRLTDIQLKVAGLRTGIWRILNLSFVGASLVLAWIAICQIGMILHGLRLLRGSPKPGVSPAAD